MFNGERLTLARTRRGLKKAQFARLVGKVPRTIADYENGNTVPTDAVVQQFSEQLSFPTDFFYQPLGDTMPMAGTSFRALTRMTATQRDAALAVGTFGIELNRWIEERFDLPEADIPELQSTLIDPEGAAALVRTRWGLGEAPISNMIHLLESRGVRVFSLAEECREVDAFSAWVGQPYVCLATYKTAERAIFDAAHELGHLVLHRDHGVPRGRAEEREADLFASSFLMPHADIDAEAPMNPDLSDLVHAKQRWRVSAAALNYRLHQLGYTTDWHYRELCIELGQFGRDREPLSLQREQSQVLLKVFTAMREEGVTRRDIAEALFWYQPDLDALTFGLAMSVLDGEGDGTGRPAETGRSHLRLVQD